MQEDPVTKLLLHAEQAWSGSHGALAARLARPNAARLTEEQEALALGIVRCLVLDLAGALPLRADAETLWQRWRDEGLPSANLIAPAVLARVEEYCWRRAPLPPAPDAIPPLFASAGVDRVVAVIDELAQDDAGSDDAPTVPAGPAQDSAYLALRIADGARFDALDRPILRTDELDVGVLRALLLDIAAQDLAGDANPGDRAGTLAEAIDGLVRQSAEAAIDQAARNFVAALDAAAIRTEACSEALARGDWLVVIATLSACSKLGFSRTAAAMSGADEIQLIAMFEQLGVAASALGPLFDIFEGLPGRMIMRHRAHVASDAEVAAALTARAKILRGDAS